MASTQPVEITPKAASKANGLVKPKITKKNEKAPFLLAAIMQDFYRKLDVRFGSICDCRSPARSSPSDFDLQHQPKTRIKIFRGV